jgi:hypothetical protein
MAIKSSEKELKSKLKLFKKTKSLNEKLRFWTENLGMSFLEYLEKFNDLEDYREFEVRDRNDKSSWEELNNYIIKNYSFSGDRIYLNLKNLLKKINNELRTTRNKEEIINKELKKIDDSLKHYSPSSSGIYNVELEAYQNYFNYQISPDYSSIPPGLHILRHANGKTLAEYKTNLLDLKNTLLKARYKVIIDEKLTINQIGLLLKYSGALEGMEMYTSEKARLFSNLLNIDYKNLYDCFRELDSKKRNRQSELKEVLKFAEANKLKSVMEKLKKEIIDL